MVKIVGNFFDRRAGFVIIIYNRNDDIRAAVPVVEPAVLHLDVLRPRRSTIADIARDILQVLLEESQDEESMLRDYVTGVGYLLQQVLRDPSHV